MDTGTSNEFQLAFIDLGLAGLNLIISIFLNGFQQILTFMLDNVLSLFGGTTT